MARPNLEIDPSVDENAQKIAPWLGDILKQVVL